MRYEILGETLPVVICYLESGEKMVTEGGGMSWMSPNMKMETTSNGGIGKDLWKSVFRRKDVPECLYITRRRRDDCLCFMLPGIHQGI